MPISVYEMHGSREVNKTIDGGDARLMFFAKGSTNDADIRAAFDSEIPTAFSGVPLSRITYRQIDGDYWEATAEYQPRQTQEADGGLGGETGTEPPEPGEPGGLPEYSPTDALGNEFSFNISGQTEHITQSLQTISKTKRNGGVAPDNRRAIRITANGEVQGVDRITPRFEYSMTITVGFITLNYLQTLKSLVGTTNNATFHGQNRGEVLLLGVNGQSKDAQKYTITFHFASEENQASIDVCGDGTLIVPLKRGHEYLWVSYKETETEGVLFAQPDSAYVEEIYAQADWSQLKIGS